MDERLGFLGRVVVMMALFAAPACSESKHEPSKAADAAAAADADAAADAVDSGVDAGPSDLELLSACEVEQPCPSSGAQMADGRPYGIGLGTDCLLERLQERAPGRYIYKGVSTHPMGEFGMDHVLIVRADGSALYARTQYSIDIREGREDTMTPEPTQLCTLRDPSYFAECLAAVQQVEPPTARIPELPWNCVFGKGAERTLPGELQWFESCEPASATCE
jgi:hypothetical protein